MRMFSRVLAAAVVDNGGFVSFQLIVCCWGQLKNTPRAIPAVKFDAESNGNSQFNLRRWEHA